LNFLNSTTPLTHILCGFAAMLACIPHGICALAWVIFGFLFASESQQARFKFLILPVQCELKCWADKTLAQPTCWKIQHPQQQSPHGSTTAQQCRAFYAGTSLPFPMVFVNHGAPFWYLNTQ
jgi:hypothetical protein